MKQNVFLKFFSIFLIFLAGNAYAADGSRYPVMQLDTDTWIELMNDYKNAPVAKIDVRINREILFSAVLEPVFGTSMDLIDFIDYDPAQRNQGSCGNCWVWASTGAVEIAHNVQDFVYERLSIQYLNSCKTDSYACCGGSAGGFATWYNGAAIQRFVPWDNTNASFADGGKNCAAASSNVTCASISTNPNFPIASISEVRIATTSFWDSVDQATAIQNIKNILNQDKGIYFGFSLPDNGAWDDFFDYWDGVGVPPGDDVQETLWPDTDTYCGDDWRAGEAGGHAVLILGYNDDDPDPANHYWLTLNSWGNAGGDRPEGLFRIPMLMNYSCVYPIPGTDPLERMAAFVFYIFDVEFENAPPVADANGPYNVECAGTTTSVALDGSGSFDPEEFPLDYAWSTDCAGSGFDNSITESPNLTVATSLGCDVNCRASLTVTDTVGDSDSDDASINISDTLPPVTSCPSDVTRECDQSTEPSATGQGSVADQCDPDPAISYSDVTVAGDCTDQYEINRSWASLDECGLSSSCTQLVSVEDTTPPVLSAPGDITIECDESSDPSNTGMATATDNCDTATDITYSDVITEGGCSGVKVIDRTWSVEDNCSNSTSAQQIIDVVDTTPPDISCNAADIIPSDAAISYTATAVDNCDQDPLVEIVGYGCVFYTKKGKEINRDQSCIVSFADDTITIDDSGGISNEISWTVQATDCSGNRSELVCSIGVVKKIK